MADVKKIILSQNFDLLAECLSAALQDHPKKLQKQWVFVPTIALKQWLLTQLARFSPTGGVAGCKICTLDEWIYLRFPQIPTALEMRCLIYQALTHENAPEVTSFINRSPCSKLELSRHLSGLFFSYGKYGLDAEGDDWQRKLYHSLFSDSSFRMPIQVLSETTLSAEGPIHCFGFDTLPPLYWEWIATAPSSVLYTFSPCYHFWEDVCTDREQNYLTQIGKKRGSSLIGLAQMHEYFSQMPPMLANLGKMGRETMKILDPLSFDAEPVYAQVQKATVLGSIQAEIVSFEKVSRDEFPFDDSIQVFLTGASQLHEIEVLCDEILRLAQEKGLHYSEMAVLAPDIQSYVSLIEFAFTRRSIPYRFPLVSIERQSSFYQGLYRLIGLAKGSWTSEKVCTLFETLSFARKAHLEAKELISCSAWVKEIFQYSSNWEDGFNLLLKRSLTLFPGPRCDATTIGEFDLLEKCLHILQSLQADFSKLSEERLTLGEWALKWQEIAEKYLAHDFTDEMDVSAWNSFCNTLKNLRESDLKLETILYPFEVIEDVILSPIHSAIHGNHLHAVCCASIQEGSVVPSRAVFMIGMDEESFPRKNQPSSLDLLKKEPDVSDVDRYLFLQVILNAQEFLRVSYGHLSPDDGKLIGPSLLVQELMQIAPVKTVVSALNQNVKNAPLFRLKSPDNMDVSNIQTIMLSDLVSFARHPWKYYLQKVHRIYLEDRKERSFAAVRSTLSRSSLQWPLESVFSAKKEKLPGIFQEAFFLDVKEKSQVWQQQLDKWGKKIRPLAFLYSHNMEEFAPLKITLESGSVISLIGDIPFSLEDGALHFGDDTLSSLLKVWPEVLAVSMAIQSKNIYFLKSGKVKTLIDPETSLKNYLSYYLRCQNCLSPLIPDWADALLRKQPKDFVPEFDYEDVVNQWISDRLEVMDAKTLFVEWDWLKASFAGLIQLYPQRGKDARV